METLKDFKNVLVSFFVKISGAELPEKLISLRSCVIGEISMVTCKSFGLKGQPQNAHPSNSEVEKSYFLTVVRGEVKGKRGQYEFSSGSRTLRAFLIWKTFVILHASQPSYSKISPNSYVLLLFFSVFLGFSSSMYIYNYGLRESFVP